MLILRRAHEQYWHVVAGVDLERPLTYALTKEFRARYGFPPEQEEVTTYNFAAEAPPGWEPVLDEEHDAYGWCSFDEAVSTLYWPSARDIARELAIRPR